MPYRDDSRLLCTVFDTDREVYLLMCGAMLRELQEMTAEVKSWPPSEQMTVQRLARRLQELDERVRQLLVELSPPRNISGAQR